MWLELPVLVLLPLFLPLFVLVVYQCHVKVVSSVMLVAGDDVTHKHYEQFEEWHGINQQTWKTLVPACCSAVSQQAAGSNQETA